MSKAKKTPKSTKPKAVPKPKATAKSKPRDKLAAPPPPPPPPTVDEDSKLPYESLFEELIETPDEDDVLFSYSGELFNALVLREFLEDRHDLEDLFESPGEAVQFPETPLSVEQWAAIIRQYCTSARPFCVFADDQQQEEMDQVHRLLRYLKNRMVFVPYWGMFVWLRSVVISGEPAYYFETFISTQPETA